MYNDGTWPFGMWILVWSRVPRTGDDSKLVSWSCCRWHEEGRQTWKLQEQRIQQRHTKATILEYFWCNMSGDTCTIWRALAIWHVTVILMIRDHKNIWIALRLASAGTKKQLQCDRPISGSRRFWSHQIFLWIVRQCLDVPLKGVNPAGDFPLLYIEFQEFAASQTMLFQYTVWCIHNGNTAGEELG